MAIAHGIAAMHHDEKVNGFGPVSLNLVEERNRFRNLTDYLKKSTELVRDYNVGQYVETFSLGTTYRKIDFHNAIAHGFGARPRVRYNVEPNIHVMHEVHLCFDLNFNPTDCYLQSDTTGDFLYSNCCDNVDKAIVDIDENDPERYAPC